MVKGIKDLGNNRYRETFGRYFEDFEIGHIYEHRPGRTITQSDNTWFTLLTMNTHPLHFDEEYGKATEFGKTLVNSTFTVAVMVGMSVRSLNLCQQRKSTAKFEHFFEVFLDFWTRCCRRTCVQTPN